MKKRKEWVHIDDYERLEAELAAIKELHRWRKWPEERPETEGWYLVRTATCGCHFTKMADFDLRYVEPWGASNVTHWRPIDLPEEG